MAYAPLYKFFFESEVAHKDTTITIYMKDWYAANGYSTRKLGAAPVLRREQRDHIHGSSLQLFAEAMIDGEYAIFGRSESDTYYVDVQRGSTIIFRGYITPELYSEPDIAVPYDVEINATDGLGDLKYRNYGEIVKPQYSSSTGKYVPWSLKEILTKLINATGITYDTSELFGEWCTIQSSEGYSIGDYKFNFDNRSGDRAYDVLNDILSSLNAELFIDGLKARLVRLNDFGNPEFDQQPYGEIGSLKYSSQLYWPVGHLSNRLIAPKKSITVSNDCELIEVALTKPSSGGFKTRITENVPRVDVDVIVRGYGVGAYYDGNFKIKVKLEEQNISESPVYINESGGITTDEVWMGSGKIEGSGPDDLGEATFQVPIMRALAYCGETKFAKMSVIIDGGPQDQYLSIFIKAVSLKGYKDIISISNGARNSADDVESVITRATSSMSPDAYFLMYGLPHRFYGNNNQYVAQPTEWFSMRHTSDKRDYLSFLAWDYAYYNAVPKVQKDGKVATMKDSIDFILLADGDFQVGTFYFVHTYNWDLLLDEAEIVAESIVEATLSNVTENISSKDAIN